MRCSDRAGKGQTKVKVVYDDLGFPAWRGVENFKEAPTI